MECATLPHRKLVKTKNGFTVLHIVGERTERDEA